VADSDNFPTAIVSTRPAGVIARYDSLAEAYGDPLETLFKLQSGPSERAMVANGEIVYVRDDSLRLAAAKELLPYRHAKQRVPDIAINTGGEGGVNIQINMGPPPEPAAIAPQEIDVTPTLEEMLK
jgi:hypothetical protein